MLGALPSSHAVAASVRSLEVDRHVQEVAVAGVVDEGSGVLSEAPPIVDDVERETELVRQPFEGV